MFNPYRGMNSVSNWAYMHYYPQQLFEMQNLPTSKSLCSFTVPFPSFQFLQSYYFGQLPTTFAAASNIKPHPVSSSEVSYSAEEVSKFASIENKEKKYSEIIILYYEDADDDINGNAKSKFITIGEGKPVRRQDQTTWISELRRHRISKRREQELAKIYEKLNNPRRDLEEYLQKYRKSTKKFKKTYTDLLVNIDRKKSMRDRNCFMKEMKTKIFLGPEYQARLPEFLGYDYHINSWKYEKAKALLERIHR